MHCPSCQGMYFFLLLMRVPVMLVEVSRKESVSLIPLFSCLQGHHSFPSLRDERFYLHQRCGKGSCNILTAGKGPPFCICRILQHLQYFATPGRRVGQTLLPPLPGLMSSLLVVSTVCRVISTSPVWAWWGRQRVSQVEMARSCL